MEVTAKSDSPMVGISCTFCAATATPEAEGTQHTEGYIDVGVPRPTETFGRAVSAVHIHSLALCSSAPLQHFAPP